MNAAPMLALFLVPLVLTTFFNLAEMALVAARASAQATSAPCATARNAVLHRGNLPSATG